MLSDREAYINESYAAIGDNIAEYRDEICALSEKNAGAVDELAYLVLTSVKRDAELGIPLAESFVNRLSGLSLYATDGLSVIPENTGSTENILRHFNTVTATGICRAVAKSAEDFLGIERTSEVFMYPDSEEPAQSAYGKVSYFKNVFADEAFSAFAKKIKLPKARYENSFENVCEAVSSGESEYGILPVENLSGGRLFSFCSMIEKYDLKGVSYCFVTSKNGSERTKFMLLRKNLAFAADRNAESEIELTFSPEPEFSLTMLLSAADSFDMKLIRVDSIPDSDRENEYRATVMLAGSTDSLVGFILFLLYRRARYSVIGIYSKEEN